MTKEEAISIMSVIVHMLEPQYDTDRIEAEQGSDGQIHFICPKWDKKEGSEK